MLNILQALLIGFKVIGLLNCSWWMVFVPLYIYIVFNIPVSIVEVLKRIREEEEEKERIFNQSHEFEEFIDDICGKLGVFEYAESVNKAQEEILKKIKRIDVVLKDGRVLYDDTGYGANVTMIKLMKYRMKLDCVKEIRVYCDGWYSNLVFDFLKPLDEVVPVTYYKLIEDK